MAFSFLSPFFVDLRKSHIIIIIVIIIDSEWWNGGAYGVSIRNAIFVNELQKQLNVICIIIIIIFLPQRLH